jgi:hypothetical protein
MLWSLVQSTTIKTPAPVLSADCQNVVGLATSMKMTAAQISTLKTANCCSVLGVYCYIGNQTSSIDWQGLNLNGTVSGHLSNLTAITSFHADNNNLKGSLPALPRTLKSLSLNHNQFTGAIPHLPEAIEEVYLADNHFSGKLPALTENLWYFYASNNKISGNVTSFPQNLACFDVQSNHMSGHIPDLPSQMTDLVLQNNKFSGKLPVLPTSLVQLNLATNKMSGPLPSSLPSNLAVFNVYDNSFSGPVPSLPAGIQIVNIYNNQLTGQLTVQRPVQLVANVNQLTGVTVNDLSRMAVCDISNNPIWKNTLDSNLLGNCWAYGLKSPRPVGLGKRSIDDADVLLEKRTDPQVANAEMLFMTILLSIIASVAALF